MKPTYIALDCETGGTTHEVSLLTLYIAVFDEKLCLIDSLDLAMKPSDKIYHVTAEALTVNRIDLPEHDAKALSMEAAGTAMYDFLNKHNPDGATKLVPIGHNVAFDLLRAKTLLRSWDKYVSYRTLDTGSIAQFLKLKGILPESVSGSLTSLAEHYQIPFVGMAHTAKADTLTTVQILIAMLGANISFLPPVYGQ